MSWVWMVWKLYGVMCTVGLGRVMCGRGGGWVWRGRLGGIVVVGWIRWCCVI